MLDDKKPKTEGYGHLIKKGYQPSKPVSQPTGDPKPQGGYVPASSGENPSNRPSPPGDE